MTATVEISDIEILSTVQIPGVEYFELSTMEVPVTVKVTDGDGDIDSQICVINPEDSLLINNETSMKISEFMKYADLDALKMADICCNEGVINEAQHWWIYGDKSLIVQ